MQNKPTVFIRNAIYEIIRCNQMMEENLKVACGNALDSIQLNFQENDQVFLPLLLICQGNHEASILIVLDCFTKIFECTFTLYDHNDFYKMSDIIIDILTVCFKGKKTEESIQIEIIRVKIF